MNIIIVGTGGMAKEVFGLLKEISRLKYGISILGFVSKDKIQGTYCNLPILGDDEWLLEQKSTRLVLANANPAIRKSMYEKFSHHTFPTCIHPDIVRMGYVEWGIGTTIMPGCVLQPDIKLGRFVHMNMGVTIGHDCKIGDFCTINPNTTISGNVTIQDEVLIGAGATILETNQIGSRANLGAGAVLTKSIPGGETWIGVPAKPKNNGY